MATIESQDLSIGKLFNDFYVVPSYQREYVWEKGQVTDFLNDIYDEFSANNSGAASEYFIGSIIVCSRRDGLYEVIDGQQRITTAYLVLCAIRDYLQEVKPDESIELLKSQIASTDIDQEGNNIFRYRVTLQYEDSYGILEKIAKQEVFDRKVTETRSSQNIKNAYSVIVSWLRNQQNDSSAQNLKKFYAYFNKNVILVRVKTASVADALRVFATINYRGVSLDAIDLVKNLMFMKANKTEYDQLKGKWKKMVDLLFAAKENPMRFIRYFILARYDSTESLKESGMYNWFLSENHSNFYDKKPIAFVDEMLDAANAYVQFLNGNDVEGKRNRYLENIRQIGSSVKMPLMILLAGQHLPTDWFAELCCQVENIFFAYLITREPTSKFERRFTEWCSKLRQVKNKSEFDTFINICIQTEKQKVAERFDLIFSKLEESSLPKSQLRYILAKLTQYIDELAWGKSDLVSNLKNYTDKVEIEHILPQNPVAQIQSSFDNLKEIDSYIKRLGNLTLVEKSINASVGNKPFEEKKKAYKQSRFLLTKLLAEKVTVGTDTAVDRAVRELETFDRWTSKSIERRQEMLTQLAKKVWDMPG
jgi:uncharacterized protein with ParB-like and HNH nuclease domain